MSISINAYNKAPTMLTVVNKLLSLIQCLITTDKNFYI